MSQPQHTNPTPRPVATGSVMLAALATVWLGVGLRFVLGGAALPAGSFANLRHAHTHLGYYGVLFPLMWAVWRTLRVAALPGRWLVAYGVGVALSFAGFASSGYGPMSIAGSTLVLGVWLRSAWALRGHALPPRGRWGAVPWGIVLGACFIPPVAVFTRRDPAFAAQLVHTFLSMLLLLSLVPTAMRAARIEMPSASLYLPTAAFTALRLGVMPWWGLSAWPVLLALLIGRSALRTTPDKDTGTRPPMTLRVAWAGLAFGLCVFVAPWPFSPHHLAVAGVHYAALGPLLMSAHYHLAPRPLSGGSRAAYLGAVTLLCGLIAAMDLSAAPWLRVAVAHTSALVAALVSGGIARWCWYASARGAHQQPT